MKAERRHELRTNTLAAFLSDLPYYLRFHANKVLVGVIVVCVAILLYRYRADAVRKARELTRSSLSSARFGIAQLRAIDRTRPTDEQRAADRRQLALNIAAALDQVMEGTKDPADATIRAEALILRGDLNWTLANLPSLSHAATQPTSALPRTSIEYLDGAEDAYRQVLRDYPAQTISKVTAMFALAAIEENRGNWDRAVEQYRQILLDQSVADVFKELARRRLSWIPEISQPAFLGTFSSTQPATAPATATTDPP